MESIIASIITGVLALVGVIVTNMVGNSKISNELHTSQAVTDTKLTELTREVREHNQFAQRIPLLERDIEGINKRLDKLEEKNND